MTAPAVSALVDAISQNNPTAVANILDKPGTVIDQEALVALVRLAWKTRAADENPDQIEPAESARQIFDLLSASGADFNQETPRGRIIDRIANVQPDWPEATDRVLPAVLREIQPSHEPSEEDEDFVPSRASRGATHRTRRP